MNNAVIDFVKVLGIATIFMLLFSFIFGILNNMILILLCQYKKVLAS